MKKVAIFCEGKTDIEFLMKMIKSLRLKQQDVLPQIMGNKENFFKVDIINYETVKKYIRINQIGKLLFILDADNAEDNHAIGGYKNTENKIDKIRTDLGWKNISQVYIMHDPNNPEKEGNLESLLLSTIDEKRRECIESFLDCSKIMSKEDHKNVVNKIYNMLYPDEPHNFNHPNFKTLRDTLKELFK